MLLPRLTRVTLLLTAITCAAQVPQPPQTKLVEPPSPLLPKTLNDFTKSTPAPIGDGLDQLDPTLNPTQAAVAREDGIKRFDHAQYTAGQTHATLTAYQFQDASGAYAAFCFSRPANASAPAKPLGDHAAIAANTVVFQAGTNLVVAEIDNPARALPLLNDLIAHLPKVAGPAAQPPLLPTFLPEKNLLPTTARYALGPAAYTAMGGILPANLIAFNKSAEAITATYNAHAHTQGTLTVLLYPTPAIAGDQARTLQPTLPANAQLRREGPMLAIATGGFSTPEAQQLVGQVHLHDELTWNKPIPPEFHTEIRKTASLLTSILVLSGVLGLAAILLGLFLGFGRAGIRVLMGKPAASEPEFLRIDLSGPSTHNLRDTPPNP